MWNRSTCDQSHVDEMKFNYVNRKLVVLEGSLPGGPSCAGKWTEKLDCLVYMCYQ